MTTFTTNILTMYTLQQPDPNYVVNICWNVTAVNGSNIVYVDGITEFDSSQQITPFVPYDQLTEATVIGWIPAEDITQAQERAEIRMNALLNPPASPQDTALPW